MPNLSTNPVWRGSTALTETDDSPEITQDENGLTVTQTYVGAYADCLSKRPEFGSAIQGFGNNVTVRSTRLVRGAGGRGVLTVVSKFEPGSSADGGGSSLGPPEYEVDWVRYDMPLATHKMFKDAIDSDKLKEIEDWLVGPKKEQPSGWSEAIKKYVAKRLQGIESYMLFVPVVRRITPYGKRPTTSAAGKRENPPVSISGFEFVKTADSARMQQRRWTRTEEWTGSYYWDPDLYANS